jgi:hypothetical protein
MTDIALMRYLYMSRVLEGSVRPVLKVFESRDTSAIKKAFFATAGNQDPKCLASRLSKVFSCYDYYIQYSGVESDKNVGPESVCNKIKPIRTDETDYDWDMKMLHWTIDEIERIQYREYYYKLRGVFMKKSTIQNTNLKRIQCIRSLCKQLKKIQKHFRGANDVVLKVMSEESKNVITVNKEVDKEQVFPLEKNKYVEKVSEEFEDVAKLYRQKLQYNNCREDMLGLLGNRMPPELVGIVAEYIIG